jgi:hypothetical protein
VALFLSYRSEHVALCASLSVHIFCVFCLLSAVTISQRVNQSINQSSHLCPFSVLFVRIEPFTVPLTLSCLCPCLPVSFIAFCYCGDDATVSCQLSAAGIFSLLCLAFDWFSRPDTLNTVRIQCTMPVLL